MYFYSGMCPLNFQRILLQVIGTSPKLNVSHSTEGNSSQRGGVWFKGYCPISLSVTQNNCWLVQRTTCKKICRVRLKCMVLLQNCKMKSKRIIVVLKCKMLLAEKIDKNVQFKSLFLGIPKKNFCVWVKQVTFYI